MISDVLTDIAGVAISRRVDELVLLGDIFNNNRPFPVFLDVFSDFISKVADVRTITIISGNHDYATGGCITDTLAKLLTIRKTDCNIRCISPGEILIDDGIAYAANGADLSTTDFGGMVVFGHFGVAGMSASESGHTLRGGVDVKYLDKAKLCILGDIHKHQHITKNIYHIGTPYPITISDVGTHYSCYTENSVGTDATAEFIQTLAPIVVRLDDDTIEDKYNLPNHIVVIDTNDISKKTEYESKFSNAHSVMIRPKIKVQTNISHTTATKTDHKATLTAYISQYDAEVQTAALEIFDEISV